MRLWSLHPKYLDRQGLLAVWREGLLAQKVLQGETKGYRHHPQLVRFRTQPDPPAAIAAYLAAIADEASRRKYTFDRRKIAFHGEVAKIPVRRGQLSYEWKHLKAKLRRRDPVRYGQVTPIRMPETHSLFVLVEGGIEEWERATGPDRTRSR